MIKYYYLKKMIFILYKIYNIKMSIRQDWEPVIIGNNKTKNKNNRLKIVYNIRFLINFFERF